MRGEGEGAREGEKDEGPREASSSVPDALRNAGVVITTCPSSSVHLSLRIFTVSQY